MRTAVCNGGARDAVGPDGVPAGIGFGPDPRTGPAAGNQPTGGSTRRRRSARLIGSAAGSAARHRPSSTGTVHIIDQKPDLPPTSLPFHPRRPAWRDARHPGRRRDPRCAGRPSDTPATLHPKPATHSRRPGPGGVTVGGRPGPGGAARPVQTGVPTGPDRRDGGDPAGRVEKPLTAWSGHGSLPLSSAIQWPDYGARTDSCKLTECKFLILKIFARCNRVIDGQRE